MKPEETAFLQLVSHGMSGGYNQNQSVVTFKDSFTWLVVFQHMTRLKYAVVKNYNGQYSVAEI